MVLRPGIILFARISSHQNCKILKSGKEYMYVHMQIPSLYIAIDRRCITAFPSPKTARTEASPSARSGRPSVSDCVEHIPKKPVISPVFRLFFFHFLQVSGDCTLQLGCKFLQLAKTRLQRTRFALLLSQLLLALLEPSEVILDQERCVELANRDVIVSCKSHGKNMTQ